MVFECAQWMFTKFRDISRKNPESNLNCEAVFGKPVAALIQMIEEMGVKKNHRVNLL